MGPVRSVPTVKRVEHERKQWLRFFFGLVLLSGFFAFFASGYTPPGAFGDVLRNNQEKDIDASPLFYSEVENMHELEAGLAELLDKQEESR
jgi:hypothetical protein